MKAYGCAEFTFPDEKKVMEMPGRARAIKSVTQAGARGEPAVCRIESGVLPAFAGIGQRHPC